MYVYIDCGAHQGKTVETFRAKYPQAEIYAFEPNPAMPELPSTKFVRAAIGTQDGRTKLYKGHHDDGSTTMQGKFNVDYKDFEWVDCVDFSRWLKMNVNAEDYVHVKMNVEGAEAIVLPELFRTGAIELIDRLEVDFHFKKGICLPTT